MRAQWRWPVGMPLCRPMGQGLWEIRTDLPSNRIARVLIALDEGVLVALHAFIKKSQKTPPDDVAIARRRLKELQLMSKRHHGSTLDDFLRDEGTFEETQTLAIKEVVVWQLAAAMQQRSLSKARLAALLGTSRSQVDRLLDPTRDVTLSTLQRAAALVGRKVQIELV